MNEVSLPHHKLVAYQVAIEFLRCVYGVGIRDADQREQARKSAKSAARNIAEAAGRWSRADKGRIYGIARGEVCEACAAVEIAAAIGCASEEDVRKVNALGKRLSDILGRLMG
ncbi:MAG TPA: four helix bundle protein [Polyangiaceae bacterium]|jgi:four helix bundle protein